MDTFLGENKRLVLGLLFQVVWLFYPNIVLSQRYGIYVGGHELITCNEAHGTIKWEAVTNSNIVWVSGTGPVGRVYISQYFEGNVKVRCSWIWFDNAIKKTDSKDYTVYCNKSTLKLKDSNLDLDLSNSYPYQLEYTTVPDGLEFFNIEWKSSNKNIATVDDEGVVRTVGEGECTITADGHTGNSPATCHITVKDLSWVKADIPDGIVRRGTKVTLTCTKSGGIIYYTTDGSEPTKNSVKYTTPIVINNDMTIKAKAWVGTESSSTLTLKFCASAYLPGEKYIYTTKEGEKLTLYAQEYNNKCCWVVGLGNDNSPAINPSYKGIITIPDEVEGMYVTHINSYAFKNCNLSGVTFPKHGLFLRFWGRAFQGCCNLKSIDIPSFVYLYSEAFIDCASLEEVHFDGYFLYFGTKSNPPYNQGMMFQGCNNIKKITIDHYPAMGFRDDTFTQSVYANATLYVPSNLISTFKSTNGWKNFKNIKEIGCETQEKLILSANPSGGSVDSGTKVYLTASANSSTVSGANIYYTLNGSTPSTSSTKYTSSGISITENCTLKAIAYKDGYETSNMLTASYTLKSPSPSGIGINATNFPDENFRNYVVTLDTNNDGKLSDSEIKVATSIILREKNISSLKGIEYFTAVKYLDCSANQLTSLDISKNTVLSALFCDKNELTTLNVLKNTALTKLSCKENQLAALDVSKNTALSLLDCSNNQLAALDVSKNIALETLYCSSNKLATLDVSKNTALTDLTCNDNQLTSLDVSKNTALTLLGCYLNQIRGSAMDKLVNSLNSLTGKDKDFFVIAFGGADDNVCTKSQVAVAKSKGWTVRKLGWSIYEGSEDTPAEKLSLSANPSGGSVDSGTKVYLTASANGTTVSGANIYYTLNGSTPSTSSTKYTSSGISITQSCTLKAIAYKDGYETSQVLTASYTVESTPYITLVSAICDNTNLDNLSQNDKLVFRATWKNIGKTDNITTILGLKKEGTNTLLYMSPQVTKSFQKDKEVICTYELPLSNVAEGKYLANVYYYKHWDDKLWWSWDNRAKIIWVNSAPVDEGVKINATNFPDENFRNYLLSQDYGKDGSLTEEEIKKVTTISVSGSYNAKGNIESLKGIEYFTALTELYCNYNQLTSLDVSKNTALTTLWCYHNQLTSLDVSKNTALEELDCSSNQLSSLDLSKNTALYSLDCSSNQLTSLDVSKNTALVSLSCSYNQLNSLDLSKNTALWYLDCGYNQLTSLDVSKNTALTNLKCYDNYINGLAMDALVNSLNNLEGWKGFMVIDLKEGDENVCTKSQVAIAKRKGWNVLDSYWDDYEGSADTPSGIQMMSQEEWAKDNWFDLQGRRISKPTAKGVYINNGNKVMVK